MVCDCEYEEIEYFESPPLPETEFVKGFFPEPAPEPPF